MSLPARLSSQTTPKPFFETKTSPAQLSTLPNVLFEHTSLFLNDPDAISFFKLNRNTKQVLSGAREKRLKAKIISYLKPDFKNGGDGKIFNAFNYVENYQDDQFLFHKMKSKEYIFFLNAYIAIGGNVNITDKTGNTLLQQASFDGHLNIVTMLLNCNDIDVNKASKSGKTPLLFAAREGHTLIVKKLLDAGADANKADVDKNTPLKLAMLRKYKEIIKILEERGAKLNSGCIIS